MQSRKANIDRWAVLCGFCLSVCLWATLHSYLLAAETAAGGRKEAKKSEGVSFQPGKKDPIFITSDRMEVDRKRNVITYKGQVVAIQGDMTLRSDTLSAYYTPDMKQMQEVIAEGKVQVTQGDRVATGTKAVFKDQDQTITLTGNPVVRQGNNQVSGTRIILFIEEDRAVAEGGGSERVKATIFPEELEKKDKGRAGPGKEP